MPFKIVQTQEKNRTQLVIIPSLWEEGNRLWWPPKKIQSRLIKDEQSRPDNKEWRVMDCLLKRTNIRSYQLAEAELSIMEANSDTDLNETVAASRATAVNRNHEFEVLANKLRCDQENLGNLSTDYSNVTENTTNNENIVQIIASENFNFDQILANQKILSDKIDNILQIQAITAENQQKMIQKLATQSVQLAEMSLQLEEIKQGPSVTLLKDASPIDNESFTLKPIESQRDIISLDQLLADRAEKNKLQKQLSFLCSASLGDGKTCAYKLQDILFTRDFLCNCSWAGGSRGDRSKIALKDYKNVLKFFHAMIQTWDPSYTVQDNETFFKMITRNSKQRKSMKNLRTSSKRTRKHKDKNQKKSGVDGPINNDEKDDEGMQDMQEDHTAPKDECKETTLKESVPIQESLNDSSFDVSSKEITEQEDMQQEKEKENIPLNYMSDDDIEGGLC